MTIDDKFQELCAMYAEKGDAELLELHEQRDDLTDLAQEALANVMKERGVTAKAGAAPAEVAADEPDDDSGLSADEAILWVFTDAFQAAEAIRVLREAGINHRVEDRSESPKDSSYVLLGLTVIVSLEEYDAAVKLFREKMGLFPLSEVEGVDGAVLNPITAVVLLSMFDRSDALIAAQALGQAGISFYWRDGSDETHELPDDQTVAIEVGASKLEMAMQVVNTRMAEMGVEG